MKWELEEEILLVDLYYKITDLSAEQQEFRIKELSSLLRIRAILLGVNIDDVFRNITGIKMKLQNIVYVDLEGKFGLSAYSKIDKETVMMYKYDRSGFDKKLSVIRNKYMNNKDIFIDWLINIEKNKMSQNIIDKLNEIDEYALKTKKTVKSLWKIDEINEVNQYLYKLNTDKFFWFKNKLGGNQDTIAINCYLEFLKWHNEADLEMHDKNKYVTDKLLLLSKIDESKENINKNLRSLEHMTASVKIKELLEKTPVIAFSIAQISDYFKNFTDRESVKNILINASWAVETKKGYFKFNASVESKISSEDKKAKAEINSKTVDFLDNKVSYAFTKPILLKLYESESEVRNWSDLYIKFCNYLIEINLEEMISLVEGSPLVSTSGRVYFGHDSKSLIAPKQLNNGFWAETNFSANDIVLNVNRLLERFNISHNNITIRYLIREAGVTSYNEFVNNDLKFVSNSKQIGKFINNHENFYNWLIKVKVLSTVSADDYLTSIRIIGEFAIQKGVMTHSFFEIDDPEEIKSIIIELQKNEEFVKYDESNHNRFSAALKKFNEFAVRNTEPSNLFDDYKTPITKCIQINYTEYEKVLFEKFPRGFKLGASIEVKRFKMFYKDLIGENLLDDDDTIQKVISEIGIEYEDSRIMSPQNAIDQGILLTILDYIEDSFSSGKAMIYYKSIYEQFKQELISTNVYNEKILKQVLIHFTKEKYYFKRSFITISQNPDTDPAMEVKELLVSSVVPLNYEKIESEIPHIPLVKLKAIMAQNPEFINTERNYYTHIDCIYLDQLDIEIINDIIDEAIGQVGFITRENVISELKSLSPHIFEKNYALTNLGFGNLISYYCSENYDCNGIIVSPKGSNLSVAKIFGNYCLNRNSVDLNELETMAKELGFNTLPGIYLTDVFMNFVRINKETLMRKSHLCFNVEAVDSILNKFCIGDYIALSEISTFALFPSSEYPWNSFMLESYVKNFSISFKYLTDSISISKCVGVIIKKESVFTDYNQVLIDVLASAQQNCLIDNKAALNYLYENGYIAKRRMSNIESLVANAKINRVQRGKE
jgi:hypothetical protein